LSALTKLFSGNSPPKLRYIDLINPTVFTEIDLETAEKKHMPGGQNRKNPAGHCAFLLNTST